VTRLVIVLAVYLLMACAAGAETHSSPSPGIGITRDQAIELAFQNSGDPDATVRLAESGPLNRYLTVLGEPPDRAVWAVVLDGTFPKECPAPGPCPDTPSKLVILDLFGRFVTSESPSPR